MSLEINPGPKALYLHFSQPFNAMLIDDDSTQGSAQVQDNSVRDDLQGLKLWASLTPNFTADDATNLVYNGAFQPLLTYNGLGDNTTYYVKYAYISKLDPTEYTISQEYSGTTIDSAKEVTSDLTRDPIEIPTDSNGQNPDFTNATGVFKVWRYGVDITGSTQVVGTTTQLVYEVVSYGYGGVTATIANTGIYTITGITDDVGVIRLRATYTDPDNPSRVIVLEEDLNVSKRRPGATSAVVLLTATSQAFIKPKNGEPITPTQVTLTATTSNITSPIYRWYVNNVLVQGYPLGQNVGDNQPGSPFNLNDDDFVLSSFSDVKYKLVKVVVTSTVSSISVFDSMSVFYLVDGDNALQAALANENQTVTLNAAGTAVSGLPGNSQMVVVRGATLLTSGVAYSLVDSDGFTDTNGVVKITINATTGIIQFTNIYDTSASATFRATITNPDTTTTTLDKILTVNRVQDGQPADPTVIIDLASESDVLSAANDGTGYDLTGLTNQIYLYKLATIVSSGVVYGIDGGSDVTPTGGQPVTQVQKTINGLTFTVTKATGAIAIAGASWTSDQATVTFTALYSGTTYSQQYTLAKSKAGTDSIHIDLKSESDVIATNNLGLSYTLPSNNEIRLYKGGVKLTTGVTYSPLQANEVTQNGLTLYVTPAGVITLSGASWTSSQEFFTVSATYNSKTYSKTYTITKSVKGDKGEASVQVNITNDSHNIPADGTGVAVDYTGATSTASINLGGVDDSNNWTWQVNKSSNLGTDTDLDVNAAAQAGNSKIKGTLSADKRTFTVTEIDKTFKSGTITWTATRTGYASRTGTFSISKVAADLYYIELTNDNHQLSADNSGTVSDYIGATTTATIKYNGVDDSANWVWQAVGISTGITATTTTNNRSATVTAVTTSFRTGTITFSATRTGFASLTATFSLTSILAGPKGDKGDKGADGTTTVVNTTNVVYTEPKKVVTTYLYYQSSSATAPAAPTKPSNISYSFTSGALTNPPYTGTNVTANQWLLSAPTFQAGNANKYWYISFVAISDTDGGTVANGNNITIGTTPLQGIGFSGLVTFSSNNQVSDGNNSLSFGDNGTTTIDGGNITGSNIEAARLKIGNKPTGATTYTQLYNDRIDIYSSSVLRVRLGNLNPT